MELRNGVVRAVRTAAQTAAGVLIGIPIIESLSDVKLLGSAYLVAAVVGFNAGVISFLQNVGEEKFELDIPK